MTIPQGVGRRRVEYRIVAVSGQRRVHYDGYVLELIPLPWIEINLTTSLANQPFLHY